MGIEDENAAMVSRIIKDTVNSGYITNDCCPAVTILIFVIF
jgi:hypothetical protein